jgi:hypothetical protein
VRWPSAAFNENVSPGGTIVPLIVSAARWMFVTRG